MAHNPDVKRLQRHRTIIALIPQPKIQATVGAGIMLPGVSALPTSGYPPGMPPTTADRPLCTKCFPKRTDRIMGVRRYVFAVIN